MNNVAQALNARLYPFKMRIIRSVTSRFQQPLAPLSANPYSTHLPVLVGLSRMLCIRRVAEFGCGQFSTTAFLNREAFPQLEQLDSFENDPGWIESMRATVGNDSRLTLKSV